MSVAATRNARKRRSIGLRASVTASLKCLRALSLWPARSSSSPSAAEKKWIQGQAVALLDGIDLVYTRLGSFQLRNRDGAIQRDHRRWTNLHKRVVEPHDSCPIGVFSSSGAAVNRGDCRLNVLGRSRRRGLINSFTHTTGGLEAIVVGSDCRALKRCRVGGNVAA